MEDPKTLEDGFLVSSSMRSVNFVMCLLFATVLVTIVCLFGFSH